MTELLLLDSSAAVAMLQADHPHHPIVARRVVGNRIGLAGHAVFETHSALTRMPVPRRIAPGTVARLMAANFPETRYSSPDGQARLFASFVDRGIAGGAVFDALVAGTAAEHGAILISCDRRAARVYEAVGTRYELL